MNHCVYMDHFWLDGQWWPYAQVELWSGFKRKMWCQEDIDCHRRYVPNGGVMVDIGAHVGDTLFPFAVLGCEILAFEPNPHIYSVLQANWTALTNAGVKMNTHMVAVGNAFGRRDLAYTEDLVNGGKIVPGRSTTLNVRMIRWSDDFLEGRPLAYLKVDTEGADQEILESMEPTIQKFRPVIQAEVLCHLTQDDRDKFAAWIDRVGYREEQPTDWRIARNLMTSPDVILIPK